jgi:hypothetical protein
MSKRVVIHNESLGTFEACEHTGTGSRSFSVMTEHGEQWFNRETGEWVAGPNLNYIDYRVLDGSLDEPRGDGKNATWCLRPQVATCASPVAPEGLLSRPAVRNGAARGV